MLLLFDMRITKYIKHITTEQIEILSAYPDSTSGI